MGSGQRQMDEWGWRQTEPVARAGKHMGDGRPDGGLERWRDRDDNDLVQRVALRLLCGEFDKRVAAKAHRLDLRRGWNRYSLGNGCGHVRRFPHFGSRGCAGREQRTHKEQRSREWK